MTDDDEWTDSLTDNEESGFDSEDDTYMDELREGLEHEETDWRDIHRERFRRAKELAGRKGIPLSAAIRKVIHREARGDSEKKEELQREFKEHKEWTRDDRFLETWLKELTDEERRTVQAEVRGISDDDKEMIRAWKEAFKVQGE